MAQVISNSGHDDMIVSLYFPTIAFFCSIRSSAQRTTACLESLCAGFLGE